MKKAKLLTLSLLLVCSVLFASCTPKAENSKPSQTNAGVPYPAEEAPSVDGAVYEPEMFADQSVPYYDSEEYGEFSESRFLDPEDNPLSTFSIDVDTASYSNIRRYLNDGQLPPADAVRAEECINYFSYDYPRPGGEHPVAVDVVISDCPWNSGNLLARVAVQAEALDLSDVPPSNLVFLLDVSGSMDAPDKLPLLVSGIKMLTGMLGKNDTVSIVVYAGAAGTVLEGVPGDEEQQIKNALDRLSAGGSTAGGEGIERAYKLAEEYFIEGGNNRVILCTDGDFNVGVSSEEGLESLIEKKRKSGIFLSVLGFGTGNIKDNKMETLADKGNGNYAYIDSLMEAKKVLVNEMSGTLFTVAKDVKIQVEFNPAMVAKYRLVGYDNRRLRDEDFNDDRKDAGEMGAGHTVTVFYEITPASAAASGVDDLRYQSGEHAAPEDFGDGEWMWVKLRYKEPDSDESQRMDLYVDSGAYTDDPDDDFLFASSVAEYALLLKDSEYKADADFDSLIERARESRGADPEGYRSQFIQLAEMAQILYGD